MGDGVLARLAALQGLQARLIVGGLRGEGLDLGVGDEPLVVQAAADVEVVLRLEQVVVGVRDLLLSIQPVALEAQLLGAGVAEAPGDFRLLGGDVQLELGVGQGGQGLAGGHLHAVQDQHLVHLAARDCAEEHRRQRRCLGAHGQVVLERGAHDLGDLDVPGLDREAARRRDQPDGEDHGGQRHRRQGDPPPARLPRRRRHRPVHGLGADRLRLRFGIKVAQGGVRVRHGSMRDPTLPRART